MSVPILPAMIEVVFGPAPAGEIPAIEVTNYPSPLDAAFNLSRVCLYQREGDALVITELIPASRLCLDEAIEEACAHAERRGCPRIYVQSTIGSPGLHPPCVTESAPDSA